MSDYHDSLIEDQLLDQSLVEDFEHQVMYGLDDSFEDDLFDDLYVEEVDDYYEEKEIRFQGTKIA